ncbi:MAG: division plane positioning ATPase MipZ [Acidobacteriota bacterium]
MIIVVGHTKGGVGKSTLACNLAGMAALRGIDVGLVDADRQRNSAGWCGIREALRGEQPDLPAVECSEITGNLLTPLKRLEDTYGLLIVDVGGYDSAEMRSALVAADLLVAPSAVSQFNMWATEHMDELVTMARSVNQDLEALGLLNRVGTHHRSRDEEEAREYLAELGVTLMTSVIRERKAFRRAEQEGLTVLEVKPQDPKASTEMIAAYEEIMKHAGL